MVFFFLVSIGETDLNTLNSVFSDNFPLLIFTNAAEKNISCQGCVNRSSCRGFANILLGLYTAMKTLTKGIQ